MIDNGMIDGGNSAQRWGISSRANERKQRLGMGYSFNQAKI
jgi:hypothetical protein